MPELLAALLLIGAIGTPAFAATAKVPVAFKACAALENDSQRLACYDDAARGGRPKHPDSESLRAARAAADLYGNEPAGRVSMLDRRWELDADSKLGVFNLRAHRPIFILPVFWNENPNERPRSDNPLNNVDVDQRLKSIENKFQISFKTKVLEGVFGDHGDLWFNYTQSSRWQLYNEDESRPFRETNYEPEIDLVFGFDRPLFGDWHARMLSVGAAHQSNGRALPVSRSWDRIKFTLAAERENWVVMLRPWWRIGESAATDDNPDIEDYLGRADVQVVHQRGGHELALILRHSLRGGDESRGALQFDWSFPLQRYLRGHVQVFDGYGESLIDYNHRATYVGVGLSLLPWY